MWWKRSSSPEEEGRVGSSWCVGRDTDRKKTSDSRQALSTNAKLWIAGTSLVVMGQQRSSFFPSRQGFF
jgi:hypothetical protein